MVYSFGSMVVWQSDDGIGYAWYDSDKDDRRIRPPDSGEWRPRFHERTDLRHGGLMKAVHYAQKLGPHGPA